LFFADPTTLYVADEGTGNTTDQTTNAGLEKWTLSDGTWSLDYTLQAGLIGDTYSVPGSVPGWDYGETTIGLRNLTSEVNVNGTHVLGHYRDHQRLGRQWRRSERDRQDHRRSRRHVVADGRNVLGV
jgi:hypothetical protein